MQAYQKRKEDHMKWSNSEVDNHYMWCSHCGEMVAGSHGHAGGNYSPESESILTDVVWTIIKLPWTIIKILIALLGLIFLFPPLIIVFVSFWEWIVKFQ